VTPRRALAGAVIAAASILALSTLTDACGGPSDSSPEGAFKAFAAALQAARDDPEQGDRVVALLAAADRRELQRRADASKRLGGEARTPASLLVLGRAEIAWVPKKVSVAKRQDRRAEVVVTGPEKQRARVVMVREDDGWRVSLGLAQAARAE